MCVVMVRVKAVLSHVDASFSSDHNVLHFSPKSEAHWIYSSYCTSVAHFIDYLLMNLRHSQPIVSTANVAQLAVDLLISSLSLQRMAVIDPAYFIPVVGPRDDGHIGITTPLECKLDPLMVLLGSDPNSIRAR